MNFFERQRQVKRLSGRLVFLFLLAVVGIVVVVDLAAVLAVDRKNPTPASILGTIIVASAATMFVIACASVFRTMSLRGGGGKVARELGGVLVPEDTQDPQLRRLRNVVEEIAIASSCPVPEIYVLEHERGINAFAAGWSPADAAVAVTRGSLEQLNRDELQGVIAHEFSHVVNGDMRLNIKLIGLLFGILFLAVIGRTITYFGGGGGDRRDDKGNSNNPLPIIGIALFVAGYVGVFIGHIIQASVSRQREYLADASAVQFTRQTRGIAGALKKIAGVPAGSKLANRRKDEVGHMLFGSALSSKGFNSLFATHPPLDKRILALEPDWDPAELEALRQTWSAAPPSGLQEDLALGLGMPMMPGPLGLAPIAVQPKAVTETVATPTEENFRRAEAILQQIPDEYLTQARDTSRVLALVYGLLLSTDEQARAHQLTLLNSRHGGLLASEAAEAAGRLRGLHPLLRLPLAQVAFPALRRAGDPEQLMATIDGLIKADGVISTFEYCLSRLLHRELFESVNRRPPWDTSRRSLASALPQMTALLSVLAQAGNGDPAQAAAAAEAGLAVVGGGRYAPPAQAAVALESIWSTLDNLAAQDKEKLVTAMVTVIGHDGTTTVEEAELLRTICAMLHCPMPPLT